MKKIIPFFILGLLYSCQIQYDVSTRYVFEGQVQDRNGNSIENIPVEVWIYNDHDSDFIGYTETNFDGYYELVIPKPKNETDFEIKVKGSSIFSKVDYVNIFETDFLDHKVTIGQTTLVAADDISNLVITLDQINLENNITSLELTGIIADQIIWVNPSEEENYTPYYFESYHKPVAKNQTLNLNYEVRNGNTGQTAVFNETIVIDSNNLTEYTINY